MTAYVDDAAILFKGKLRYHMSADSIAELHAFAQSVGINKCWWHGGSLYPHYDITGSQREAAFAAGAVNVTSKELVPITKRLRAPAPQPVLI